MSRRNPEDRSLCLFFTLGMSLKEWERTGLLEREILVYNALVKQGYKVAFFTYGDESDRELADRIPGIEIFPAFAKYKKPKSKLELFFVSLLIPFFWKKELKGYHIFKTNQMWGFWVPLLIRTLAKCKSVFVVRCGYEHYRFAVLQNKPLWKLIGLYVFSKLAYFSADHILITTEEASQFIQDKFHVPCSKITVCPNLIDTTLFSPKNSSETKKRVVFIGRLSEQKNLFSLLDAVKEANVGLDLYGKGELEEEVKLYAEQEKIDVQFKGVVPNNEIPKILSSYAAYVLPSLYEGNPKTLLEAMSCAQLVIGTKVEGIQEVIADGENGILCETSAESLRLAIEKAVSNTELKKTLGERAREYVLKTCSLDRIVQLETEMYATY